MKKHNMKKTIMAIILWAVVILFIFALYRIVCFVKDIGETGGVTGLGFRNPNEVEVNLVVE